MVRGALVTAIYRKTTEISIVALDNSAAVTLMSTDVERIVQGFRSLHEVWANVLQIGFAVWILVSLTFSRANFPISEDLLSSLLPSHCLMLRETIFQSQF